MSRHYFFLLLLMTTQLTSRNISIPAVTIVPVADLVGAPLCDETRYKQMPLCGANIQPFVACNRLHQLLFNEVVDVVEKRGEEVKVRVPNMFYLSYGKTEPHSSYWTIKKYLLPLDTLDAHKVPKPLSFKDKDMSSYTTNTVTLCMPYSDPATNTTFSAGTRFVRAQQRNKRAKKIKVYMLNPASKTFKTDSQNIAVTYRKFGGER